MVRRVGARFPAAATRIVPAPSLPGAVANGPRRSSRGCAEEMSMTDDHGDQPGDGHFVPARHALGWMSADATATNLAIVAMCAR